MSGEDKVRNKDKSCSACETPSVYAKGFCKKCYNKIPCRKEKSNKYARMWRSENKEHVADWKKNNYEKNRERILLQRKESNVRNRETIKQKSREKYCANREAIRAKQKEYGLKNKDKIKKVQKQYYELIKNDPEKKERRKQTSIKWAKENRDRVRELDRNYQKKKRENDPAFRMRTNISRHIRKVLRDSNGYKRNSIWMVLPYTPDDLKKHLESQFKDEWTWENYGKEWNIDHITPQSVLLFDNMNHPNFIKCWSLSNLRPLNCSENYRKQDKIITL